MVLLTAPVEVDIWDVKHGVCIHLVTPNKKHVLIDCGYSSYFSPSIYLNEDLRIKKLDYLVISHPHEDHIRDVENVNLLFDVKVLQRNKKIDLEQLKEENEDVEKPPNDKRLEAYFDLNKRFTKTIDWENDPENPKWGTGCTIRTFNNNDKDLEINDQSVAVFIDFGNERILYGADIKEKGWQELIKNSKFKEYVKNTTIYIAAHHGNKSGYSSELFELFRPNLTIISAGRYRDYDGTSLYDAITNGMTINSQKNGEDTRKVISTRNDGNIKITMYDDSRDTIVDTE